MVELHNGNPPITPNQSTHRWVRGVGLLLFISGVVIMAYLLYPLIAHQIYQFTYQPPARPALAAGVLPSAVTNNGSTVPAEPATTGVGVPYPEFTHNELVIDAIGVRIPIVQGETEEALEEGGWHYSDAAPGDGSNIVIAGHRFKYLPPHNETFYLLDKLQPGDLMEVHWEGLNYMYRVDEVFEVQPDAVEVAAPTETEQVTLITCTPVFTTDRRLIVKATPFVPLEFLNTQVTQDDSIIQLPFREVDVLEYLQATAIE